MTVVYALIGIVVLAWVIRRQLRAQPFTGRRIRLAAALGALGVVEVVVTTTQAGDPGPLGWGLLVLSLVIAAGFGVWRAATTRLWFEDGRPFVQGSRTTLVLWIVGIAAHVGLDALTPVLDPAAAPMISTSVLLFVGLTLGAQFLGVSRRIHAADPVGAAA